MENTYQNPVSRPFVVLNLSDLHYPDEPKNPNDKDERQVFKLIFNEFLNALSSFLNQNKNWVPNCLALIGDIANRGKKEEYDEIKKYLDLLQERIGQNQLHILPVPGNHDKFVSKKIENLSADKIKELASKHTKEVRLFMDAYQKYTELSKGKSSKQLKTKSFRGDVAEYKKRISLYQKNYFGPYSDFVKEYNRDIQLPYLDEENLPYNNITGIRILERLHVCVLLLNTEWFYFPKTEVIRKLSVGDHFIQKIQNKVVQLREEGYFVITLMHRSPYYLDWTEIYDEPLRESAFDRIVGMSDLILCGHEHNRQLKRPDFLLNTTQLFQNGTFYAQPNMSNNKKNDKYEYSASLLHIDPNKRIVQALRFNIESEPGKYKWRIPNVGEAEVYGIDPNIAFKRNICIPPHNLYKSLTLKYPENDEYIKNAILCLFYPYDPQYRKVSLPSGIYADVKDMDSYDNQRLIDYVLSLIKSTKKVCHLILYKEIFFDIDRDKEQPRKEEALTRYEGIKKDIHRKNLDKKLITNFVFCNILY